MKHLKHIKLYESFLNEGVALNKEINDTRHQMDSTDGIHPQVNLIYELAKQVLEGDGQVVKSTDLSAHNKYDGYQLRINTANDQMLILVSLGKVGMEDQRGGSIVIKYKTNQEVHKKSKHFGDVYIDVEEQKDEILHALEKSVK